MVAAKLDQSRVLVTKFCQNWLTLKGRSAGQRYTDRQTSKSISSVSFVRIESNYFYNTQETQMQKMMDQNYDIQILCVLKNFFNFQKDVPSPSAADLDHYGRGQTRSQ